MSGLFTPEAPTDVFRTVSQERAERLAAQEQERAERDRVSSIQKQLQQQTVFRNRGFGLRSLLGPFGGARSSLLGSG